MTLNFVVANTKVGIERLAELAKEVEHEEKETAQRVTLLKKLGWVRDMVLYMHVATEATSDVSFYDQIEAFLIAGCSFVQQSPRLILL